MKYNIIYADPPWSYSISSGVAGGRGQNTPYRCMRPIDIFEMPVEKYADDNCVLFLWAAYPMLPEALFCIKSWGFYYKTNAFTWIKKNKKSTDTNFFGMGQWTRRNSEICLMGTKGNPKCLDHSISEIIETDLPITVSSPIGKHSEKPDIIRENIVRLCGDVPRLEIFARENTDGWDVIGNELNYTLL